MEGDKLEQVKPSINSFNVSILLPLESKLQRLSSEAKSGRFEAVQEKVHQIPT